MEYPDIRIYYIRGIMISHFSCNFVVYRYAHVCPIFGQNLTHPKASFFSAFALAAALALALAAASGLGSAHLFPPVWKAWRLEGVGKYGNTNSSRYFLHHRLTLEIVKACLLFWIWIGGDLPLFSLQRLLNGDTTHQKLRTPQWALKLFFEHLMTWCGELNSCTDTVYVYRYMYMYDITRLRGASSETPLRTSTISAWAWFGLIWCHTRTWSTLYQSLSTFTMSPVGCPSPTSLFKVEHSDSQDTAVVTLAHHIWEDLVDTCWHQSEPAFLTSKELKLMKLDILLKLYDQTNVVHCKECASWMSQSQDPALCCSINFKFLVRVASGICGGTEPIKSNWTCSRSLQLGLVCVFERANQSCFQKIFGQWLPATLSSHSFQPKGDEHHTSTTIVTTLAFAARQDSK